MATGTLKMWNAERGYGFIADDAGGPDMLLHISALEAAGIDPANLRKGDRLSFEVEGTHDGRTIAGNVRKKQSHDEASDRLYGAVTRMKPN